MVRTKQEARSFKNKSCKQLATMAARKCSAITPVYTTPESITNQNLQRPDPHAARQKVKTVEQKDKSFSDEEEACVTEISYETLIKIRQYDFKWKIKNLQHWHENEQTGEEVLKSPKFHSVDNENNKIDWELLIFLMQYENDDDEDTKNYLEVQLCMTLGAVKKCFFTQIDAQLSLIDKDGFEAIVQKQTFTIDDITSRDAIFEKFVEADTLFGKRGFNETTALTPNNETTFLCRLFFNQGYYHKLMPTKRNGSEQIQKKPAKRPRLQKFDDFEQLLQSPNFSDIKLIVGEKEFPAHKNILFARSPFFADLLESEKGKLKEKRFEIKNVDSDVMEELLRFIYTGKVENVQILGRKLLVAAQQFQLDSLQNIIEQELADESKRLFA